MNLLLAGLLTTLALGASPETPKFEPTSNYTAKDLHGWKVYVNNRLLQDEAHQATGEKAVQILSDKLAEVAKLVDAARLEKLKLVPIWLEVDNDKHNPCACYHVSENWLASVGFNPEKVRSVEISNASRFVNWINSQPMMILHELAHGYHHRELSYENERVKGVYEKAKAGGLYEAVRRYNAEGKIVRHYALNNPMEYFAEASEAYFGRNDYYPFERAELERHDAEGYKLMVEIWGEPATKQ